MPLNMMDAHFRSFTHEVLPVMKREGIAALGMKAFGDHRIALCIHKKVDLLRTNTRCYISLRRNIMKCTRVVITFVVAVNRPIIGGFG